MSCEKLNLITAKAREYYLALDLIEKGRGHEDLEDEEYYVYFNNESGNVFLSNEDSFRVFMVNGDELLEFFTTPYSCHEGFLNDLIEEDKDGWEKEDIEYVFDLIVNNEDYKLDNLEKFVESMGITIPDDLVENDDCDATAYNALMESIETLDELLSLFKKKVGL